MMNAYLSIVSYDATRRKWQVEHGGNTIHFPSGNPGRNAANFAAAELDCPTLAKAFAKLKDAQEKPKLITRAWKALELARLRFVLNPSDNDEIARVASLSGPEEYSISFRTGPKTEYNYTCNCMDWKKGYRLLHDDPAADDYPKSGAPLLTQPYGIFCKHILAYVLASVADLPLLDFSPNSDDIGRDIWDKALQEMTPEFGRPPYIDDLTFQSFRRGILIVKTAPANIQKFINASVRKRINEAIAQSTSFPIKLEIQGDM